MIFNHVLNHTTWFFNKDTAQPLVFSITYKKAENYLQIFRHVHISAEWIQILSLDLSLALASYKDALILILVHALLFKPNLHTFKK